MKLHVYRSVLAFGFERFSAWLDSRKSWEQNLIVGLLVLAISALVTGTWQLCARAWTL
jgi:hypothetical protein